MNHRVVEPVIMVVFGASGDLAKRKLIPAIYHLRTQGLLPENLVLLGFARSSYSHDDFRQMAYRGLKEYGGESSIDQDAWDDFACRLFYQTGGYDERRSFEKLAENLQILADRFQTGNNRLFYLSTPPTVFETITTLLSEVKLAKTDHDGWARLIIEKPFGRDLESAQSLNEHLLSHFDESQIYRIDHYLGKETVQNMLVFRFGNGIFDPIWNRNYVDHVQITVAESLGIGDRGGYYDRSGAIRDMMQNHLMQLVALTAMEPPVAFDAKAVRDQKVNVMRSIKPLSTAQVPHNVVRAQYTRGAVNGHELQGYLETEGVAEDSTTDTYVAWKLEIDNWRWSGVPFYLRTGKAMPTKLTEVNIVFKRPPQMFFADLENECRLPRNVLTLRIQPNEGIQLSFDAKRPGPVIEVEPVNMEFMYANSFGSRSADAYERLLLDAMLGDGTLFIRRDEIEVAWDRVSRILQGWREQEEQQRRNGQSMRVPTYQAGTWGPAEADELLAQDGRNWRNL